LKNIDGARDLNEEDIDDLLSVIVNVDAHNTIYVYGVFPDSSVLFFSLDVNIVIDKHDGASIEKVTERITSVELDLTNGFLLIATEKNRIIVVSPSHQVKEFKVEEGAGERRTITICKLFVSN
jgi:hypothetical protein